MLIDDERKKQISEVFKGITEYKELAKGHNSTATSMMKGLVESLSADKKERKTIAKVLNKTYREWVEAQKGEEDTLTETIDLLEKLDEK